MKVTFDQLGEHARIWIYQNKTEIADELVSEINDALGVFVQDWSAHQQPLAAYGQVFHKRFIVLMVDESLNRASGCSIDSSVAFVRQLEATFDLELFDRMTFSYVADDVIHTVPKQQFKTLYSEGVINEDTLVFDNLIKTKSEWNKWRKPLGESWLKRFV